MTERRVVMNFRVLPEAKARVERLAEQLGISSSDVLRMAFSKGLPLVEQNAERLRRDV